MTSLSLDFETFNTVDLRKVGAYIYATHPDLVVTAMAWAIDTGPVETRTLPKTLPIEVRYHLEQGGRLRAWNANFEWLILVHYFGLAVPWSQVSCTMQRALYAGLPPSLEKAGRALGLPESLIKDDVGHRLMLSMAQPRRGKNGGKWHEDDPDRLKRLEEYCRQDVVAEREISRQIPALPKAERRVSRLDHETNLRGISLDTGLIEQLGRLVRETTHHLSQACAALTGGEVTSPATQTAKLARWLNGQLGGGVNSLDKGTVTELLEVPDLPDTVRQVLEIRQEVAKSSTRKLTAMIHTAGPDDRVRGQLLYYGANRTGRFAGRLIQPQNMPRPTLPPPALRAAIDAVKKGAASEWIDVAFGKPLDVVASALRSCLVPGPGKAFVAYDFKQIEARVLAWLAGAKSTLKAFADGEDIYVREQKKIGLSSRLAGKVVVLACGFGMGAVRFQETAATYGLIITLAQAIQIVSDWRDANPEIVALWYATEAAARQAIAWPGSPVTVSGTGGKISFTATKALDGKIRLAMKLPSARELFYRNARIEPGPRAQGTLTYDGVDQKTHQWGPVTTWGGKLVENAVQAIARDCLVDAAIRIEQAILGELVLSIHDELLWECAIETADIRAKSIKAEVEKSPVFAPDLPIAADGGTKQSYGI